MMLFGLCSLLVWLSVAFQALATPVRHLAFHHRHHRHIEAQGLSVSDSEPKIRIQRPLVAPPQPKPCPREVNQAEILVRLTFGAEDSEHGVQLKEVTFPMRKRIRPGTRFLDFCNNRS